MFLCLSIIVKVTLTFVDDKLFHDLSTCPLARQVQSGDLKNQNVVCLLIVSLADNGY